MAVEAGRSKPKHSWHSPALSARYGELPLDEPRYKPRLPDADQGTRALQSLSTASEWLRPPPCHRPEESPWCTASAIDSK